jgi:16S rRNA processing protein RimM
MNKENIIIAKILSAHGVKGQIKIMSFTEIAEDIKNYPEVFDKNGSKLEIKITSKAQGKNKDIFIANISDINDRDKAENLRDSELFIKKDQLAESEEDEFYYADLIDLDVVNNEDIKIGKIINMADYGAGAIAEIEFNKLAKQKEKVQMFSFYDKIFPEVNLEEGFVKIILPEFAEIK